MLFKLLHPVKIALPIMVVLSGMVMRCNPVQPENAPLPMDRIPSGISSLVSLEQFLKASLAINFVLGQKEK